MKDNDCIVSCLVSKTLEKKLLFFEVTNRIKDIDILVNFF